MRSTVTRVLLATSLSLLLAACGQLSQPPATGSATTYAVTIPLESTTTREELRQRYGGEVTLYSQAARFAVVRVDAATASRLRGQLSGLSSDGATVEPNTRTFRVGGQGLWADGQGLWADGQGLWADGQGLWADGQGLWADGQGLWADGQYAPLPENSASWRQIGLDGVQANWTSLNVDRRVRVAVLDTGIDLTHPAFQSEGLLAPRSEMRDFVDGDDIPQDEGVLGEGATGHGTNVAGVIAQIAPNVELLPLRVLDASGAGDTDVLASAIVYAVDRGARVINLSLGAAEEAAAVTAALEYAASRGVLVVASAGNANHDRANFPAAQAETPGRLGDHLVGVSSVDGQDVKSTFANSGTGVEIVAPGERIAGPAPEGRKAAWSGTSQAAPQAAGALALALGALSAGEGAAVARQLLESADDVSGLNPGLELGNGRLNVERFIFNLQQ